MAANSELDFALASFWEFAKMWKSKASSKLIFSCEDGRAHVELVAKLGLPDDHHVPQPPFQRRKTPAQLRRSEKRRKDFLEKKKEEAEKANASEMKEKTEIETEKFQTVTKSSQDVAVKSAAVKDVLCPDETYNAKIKATEQVEDKKTDHECGKRTWTVEGEFHASFPQKKFKNYLEVTLANGVKSRRTGKRKLRM